VAEISAGAGQASRAAVVWVCFQESTGDYAGRLIEAAGLKGRESGRAQISPGHANFIVNLGGATAADIKGSSTWPARRYRSSLA